MTVSSGPRAAAEGDTENACPDQRPNHWHLQSTTTLVVFSKHVGWLVPDL